MWSLLMTPAPRNDGKHTVDRDGYEGPNRRQESPIDWLQGLPVWARVLFILGPIGAIAVFLVWKGANDLPDIHRQVVLNHTEIIAIRQALADHQQQTDAIYRQLQRICSNTAKTEYERQRCFDR